jgi:asparagine synthase (glutamine-hydrolysing)
VLLSGEGSDEALLGYARHRALALLPRRGLRWLPAPGWSMRRAARFFRALAAADPFAELLAVTPPAFRREVLAGDIATAPPLPDAPTADPLQRARLLEQRWYLRRDLLPKLDVATMAAQVEGRCPYLDAAFRAAAAAIPPRRALGKAPLRAAFAARLPAGIAAQRKRGFALPLDRWFRGELSFIDLLREPRTRQRAHLRAGGLDAAIDRHRRGAADLGHALYLVVAFECWLRSREEDHACT